jgi:aspartyl/asparaginyl-tRNA synthetase
VLIGRGWLIARICELPNIREATLFPRDLHRLTP